MKKFEYKKQWHLEELEVNKLGLEGWELIQILNDTVFWFKKEIEEVKPEVKKGIFR